MKIKNSNVFHLETCLKPGETSATPSWSCWSEWSTCSVSCGGSGKRHRHRVCVPGTDNVGSQDVVCAGSDEEIDNACNSFDCHAKHCPPGYQFSSGYKYPNS